MSGTRTEQSLPEGAAAPARPRPRARRADGPLARAAANPRLAWGVALALALALAAAAVVITPLVVEAREREQVTDVAALAAVRITTFDAADLERWSDGLRALATEAYARELTGLLDERVRADLAEAGVSSRGEPADVFVQRVEAGEAVAFAVVRQVTTSAARDEPVATVVRMTLRLRKVGSQWRLDGVDVLAGGAPAPLDVPRGSP